MFGRSWRVGRVGGVEIQIDVSWSVAAILVSYSFFLRFTSAYPSLRDAAGIALAISATVLFFGSVLVHEMTHALVARRMGISVEGVTLLIFGGATRADVESHAPRQEFLSSIVGPVSSAVLGALFWGAGGLDDAVLSHPLAGALGYLGWANFLLAAFNLLPGFPLDGGKVLHSAVWAATGDPHRAMSVATSSGELIGFAMIIGGSFLVFAGASAGGIWFAAIGWFLSQTARASFHQFELRRLLAGVEADRIVERSLRSVPADVTLRDAVDEYLVRHDQDVFSVEDGGRTVGVLTTQTVQEVPRDEWGCIRVHDSMLPIDQSTVVGPNTRMEEVVERLRGSPGGYVLVESEGRLIGVLTIEDLGRWLRRRTSLAV